MDKSIFRSASAERRYLLRPLNSEQRQAAQLIRSCDVVFLTGPAGTAKTHVALGTALELLGERKFRGLVLTRPLVEAGEKTGFLPGKEAEKMRPWLEGFGDCLEQLTFENKDKFFEGVETPPLARLRGRTFTSRIAILDEAQNCTAVQLRLFLSRIGRGGKLVIAGDTSQCDLDGGGERLEQFAAALANVRVASDENSNGNGDGHRVGWERLTQCVRHPLIETMLELTGSIR